jgi:hypothetical protein
MTNFLYSATIVAGALILLYYILLYARTKVPIILTPEKYIINLLSEIGSEYINSDSVVYEMGSGWGNFSFSVEKFEPKKIIGYELSPVHSIFSRLKAWIRGSHVKFLTKDFFTADIRDATIIYVYLVPKVVEKLWRKIEEECRPGTVMILLGHDMPGVMPIKKIKTNPQKQGSTHFYIYEV